MTLMDGGRLEQRRFLKLLKKYTTDCSLGSLNYYWEIRREMKKYDLSQDLPKIRQLDYPVVNRYVQKLQKKQDQQRSRSLSLSSVEHKQNYTLLVLLVCRPANYIDYHLATCQDPSLRAVLQFCHHPDLLNNLKYSDPELNVLADIFNQIILSGRKNLHCYDCGTSSRGTFFNLVQLHRPTQLLTAQEVKQLREDYMEIGKTKIDNPKEGLDLLLRNLRQVKAPAVCVLGMGFGKDKFGHILTIEKLQIEGTEVIRFYQSALASYLLIDYLHQMRYFEHPTKGIDLDLFEQDMNRLISVKSWGEREIALFVKWFCFYPQSEIDDTSGIRFNQCCLHLG